MDPPRLERSSEFFSVASGKESMNYNCHVLITKRRVQSKLFIACTAADCMRLVVHARFNVNVSVSVHDYFLWIERLQIIFATVYAVAGNIRSTLTMISLSTEVTPCTVTICLSVVPTMRA